MGKYSVEYLPIAYDDLEDIFNYIVTDDPSAAATLLNDIDTAILQLENFPEMGANPKNRRLTNKGYKMLIVNHYLVFYAVTSDIVEIRRIVSSIRKYSKLN